MLGLKLIHVHSLRPSDACVSKQTIIGSDSGLSPGRRQAIIWTNDVILLIEPLGTNSSKLLIDIYTFPFSKMHLKMSSGKWRPLCPGLSVFTERVPGNNNSNNSSNNSNNNCSNSSNNNNNNNSENPWKSLVNCTEHVTLKMVWIG